MSSSLLHSSALTNTQTHLSCLSQTDWKAAEQGQGKGRDATVWEDNSNILCEL